MTTKMTRRTFLKGAAAAAAAVSLSGLLTGCGGDQELPDNAVQLGVFNVSIYGLNVDQGAELGGDAGAITGTVKIRSSLTAAAVCRLCPTGGCSTLRSAALS